MMAPDCVPLRSSKEYVKRPSLCINTSRLVECSHCYQPKREIHLAPLLASAFFITESPAPKLTCKARRPAQRKQRFRHSREEGENFEACTVEPVFQIRTPEYAW